MSGFFAMTPELAPGQILTVDVLDIAFGGDGVARAGDFVIFVPFTALGERVEVEVTEVKSNFARARLKQLLKPAAERVLPACPYFGDCGGCQYQHLEYAAQLRLKRKQIADILQRIGGFAPEVVEEVIACPQPYGYRNRIMIRTQWDKFKRALNIGFIRADNRLVVDVQECKIAAPDLNRQLLDVRAHPPPKGGLKKVLRQLPSDWEVPADAFFQNNFFLLPQLVEVARDRLRQSGARFLVDAYCGVGFFSLELAGQVEAFVGVEYDRLAVRAARKNATDRHCHNGEYLEGRAEDLMQNLLARFPPSQTTLLLDPPRTGCPAESMPWIRDAHTTQILYVSCHPATLARDLKWLCAGGAYELLNVIPLDMFPQTQHVECVADLRLRSG